MNKRSEYLRKITWEHHQALRYALHIRKGVANGTPCEVLAGYVRAVSEQHLEPHFVEEERALFSRLDESHRDYPVLRRVLDEHRTLPVLAREIGERDGHNRDQVASFAQMIVDHVRLEEKELFPWVEQCLTETALRAAQAQIEQMHSATELDWSDEFWKPVAGKQGQ